MSTIAQTFEKKSQSRLYVTDYLAYIVLFFKRKKELQWHNCIEIIKTMFSRFPYK